jgi:hypothetical protein
MHRSVEVVDQYGPGNLFVSLVAFGVMKLLFERMVGAHARPGVTLSDQDIDELHAIAPPGVQLPHWLDRANRDRSTVRAEAEEYGPVQVLAQAKRATADARQLEVRCRLSGVDA